MTTMQPAEQPGARSDATLVVLLVLGNLFFWGCVASRYAGVPTDAPLMFDQPGFSQPGKIALAEG